MFDNYPSYSVYRTLRLSDPRMVGEDVYALQLAMNNIRDFDNPIIIDGVLGPKTSNAIFAVQRELKIIVDGLAGQGTQRAIAQRISKRVKEQIRLPIGLPYGQLAHESSFILGNYSSQREDGSYDAGIAQRNTNYTDPATGFHPVVSIQALCQNTYNSYQKYSSVTDERRRWELAVGSWNAPYFANWYAGITPSAKPGPEAAEKFQAYIASATAYLKL